MLQDIYFFIYLFIYLFLKIFSPQPLVFLSIASNLTAYFPSAHLVIARNGRYLIPSLNPFHSWLTPISPSFSLFPFFSFILFISLSLSLSISISISISLSAFFHFQNALTFIPYFFVGCFAASVLENIHVAIWDWDRQENEKIKS